MVIPSIQTVKAGREALKLDKSTQLRYLGIKI
jgi:hypothetical protein